MNCRYCGASNHQEDHRCQRCGRRLTSGARVAPDLYPVSGSRALMPEKETKQKDYSESPPRPERRRPPYQPNLFTTRDLGRVVPIAPYQGKPHARPGRPPMHPPSPDGLLSLHQQTFEFQAPPSTRTRRPYPDARLARPPVATPMHRILAAAVDYSMVLIAIGVAATLIQAAASAVSGVDLLAGFSLYVFAGAAAFLALAYKLMWALAGTESPGLRWAQLRLLNFDGVPAHRDERLRRLVWSLVSILPAGFGLLWSLVDEESLSLHDHCSKTFLTSGTEHPGRR